MSQVIGRISERNIDAELDWIVRVLGRIPEPEQKSREAALRGLQLAFGRLQNYRAASTCTIKRRIDVSFGEYVKNKSIAIVGPANVSLPSGTEIENHDIIIRFNHSDSSSYHPDFDGSRTDVSYYTNPAFNKIVIKSRSTLAGLQFAVPQSIAAEWDRNLLSGLAPRLRGQYRRSNGIFFKSYGNAAQRLLLDLMRFESRSVKLFNMDLWLTPHDSRYIARRPTIDPKMFLYHDPVANYCFLQSLLRHQVISCDKRLAEVLSLGRARYVQALHEVYATAARVR
ncbi:hypothetical protein ACIKTA_03625 [Hansschlegelia beijingensis]